MKVSNSDLDFRLYYNQVSKAFIEMLVYALKKFKKISLQRKMNSKLERDLKY